MYEHISLERADNIRRKMNSVRYELDEEVQQVKQSAHQLTDWRYYVRKHPWACLGVATAIGFLVVPRKRHAPSVDTKTIEKLIKKNQMVAKHQPQEQEKSSLVRGAFTFLSGLAFRTATAHLVQQLTAPRDKPESASAPADYSTQDNGEVDLSLYPSR